MIILPPVIRNYGDEVFPTLFDTNKLFDTKQDIKHFPALKFAALVAASYAVVINCLALPLFALDKCLAVCDGWRIAERGLCLLICEGGIIGGWLGLFLCCHKTAKKEFHHAACYCTFVGLIILASYYGVIYAIYK